MDAGGDTTAVCRLRRSARLKTDSSTKGCDNAINPSDTFDKDYQSAMQSIFVHEYAKLYRDDWFSVFSRARSRKHVEILESAYIHVQRSVLCVQKQFVALLHLLRSRFSICQYVHDCLLVLWL